jgi:hypothetical protein
MTSLWGILHQVKKPASMDPSTLVDRAQTLFHHATYLPIDENTAGPEIPVAKQKLMMLNMFPEPLVRNFINSGQNPSTVTIVTLLSYMTEQHSAEVMYSERKRDFNHYGQQNDNTKHMRGNGNGHQNHFDDYHAGHSDNTNGNNNHYHHHDPSTDNNEHNHSHYNGNYYQHGANSGHGNGNGCTHNGHESGNQRGTFTSIQQDDECCIHGGHLWQHCSLNPCRDKQLLFFSVFFFFLSLHSISRIQPRPSVSCFQFELLFFSFFHYFFC